MGARGTLSDIVATFIKMTTDKLIDVLHRENCSLLKKYIMESKQVTKCDKLHK